MFKRLLVYLILASMIIHCAGRLGLLDSLYQQRHRIAYNLGLIAEIPFAMCSGDYEFDGKINFQADDKDEAGAPVSYQPREITLFFFDDDLNFNIEHNFLSSSVKTHYSDNPYKSPDRAIFQPPKI
ncbi:MAG: hypothetical protein LW863_12790 [Flammeovirgaceae bacterium]|nr:hypothetical protein [Flammeovirgaceae bacterium]